MRLTNMHYLRSFFLVTVLAILTCAGTAQSSDSRPVSHDIWDNLLKEHVNKDGSVDYQGFIKDSNELNRYLTILSSNHPNVAHWSPAESMAYWINAYNAFTVKLVVDNYPVESIKDIKRGIPMVNSVWDIKFIEIEGKDYDLNKIEHGILRKDYAEPRIHFAINCASISCPVLRPEAYIPEKLEEQLADQTRLFLADPSRNVLTRDEVSISKIFSWFKGDFTKEGNLIDFLNAQDIVEIDEGASVKFLEYDWRLNE